MRPISMAYIISALVLGTACATPAWALEGAHSGQPLQAASGERISEAMGHYSRARSLLIAALHEFDQGLRKVNPDALMDVKAWRSNMKDRARELERVLDPQPRASNGGVRYRSDTRLLGEAKTP